MKNRAVITLFTLLFFSLLSESQVVQPYYMDDFVTINGRYFQCGGIQFYPFSCAYRTHAVFTADPSNISPLDTSLMILVRFHQYGPCEDPDCFGACGAYDGCDSDDQLDLIRDDFEVLSSTGFNTVSTRLCPIFDLDVNPPLFYLHCNSCSSTNEEFRMPINLSVSDRGLQKWFSFIEKTLDIAYENNLKVILDVGNTNVLAPSAFPYYLEYLKLLAQHISQLNLQRRQTLMAYSLVEEPELSNKHGFMKYDVCTYFNQMYDTIKKYDYEHLVTMGGQWLPDLRRYDPTVMKIDFWSPHIYAEFYKQDDKGEGSSDQAVERVKGQLYWLSRYCTKPWIIGETGFGATDDFKGWKLPNGDTIVDCGTLHYPQVNGELEIPLPGTYYTQKSYVEDITKMVRDCGGAGYTNWEMYETWSYHPVLNPDINGDTWGFIKHGEASDVTTHKPVASVFDSYLINMQPPDIDLGGCPQPTTYYNPYNHAQTSNQGCPPYKFHHVEGIVLDDVGNPIEGAFIWAWVDLGCKVNTTPCPDGQGESDLIYTYTNSSGQFSLDAMNIRPLNYYNYWFIAQLDIMAPGSEYVSLDWGTIDDNIVVYLERPDVEYESNFSGFTITSGNTYDLLSWHRLAVDDVTIQNGAIHDVINNAV